jgi:hypothetical protein
MFVEYVEDTILGPVKEKVVSAWTNRFMHLDSITRNRVESTHARLKLYIQNCLGDICKSCLKYGGRRRCKQIKVWLFKHNDILVVMHV